MNTIIKHTENFYIIVILAVFLSTIGACKKEETVNVLPLIHVTDSIKDVEGNVYKTVLIGKQWWMAENLRVTVYNDSTPITKVSVNPRPGYPDTLWGRYKKGAYCTYDNKNDKEFIKNYGRLYNWYAVKNDSVNIAPKGWHIPTDEEWKVLEQQLGMSASDAENTAWRGTTVGQQLKSLKVDTSSTNAWSKDEYGNLYETNESGFSALAGACCMFDGTWSDPGITSMGFWWTSTEKGNDVWYRHLDYKNSNVFRYYGSKSYGFSVRCIKD